jgi:hypothetical protein
MYKYISKEGHDPLFYFTTKYNLEYFVSFQNMNFENDFFENLYSVIFGETTNQKFFKDPDVELTITTILNDYLLKKPNVILHYVCDNVDFKQDFRKKLFDKWYRNTKKNEFSKVNFQYQIPEEDINYHLGFIFKNDFYEFSEVVEKVNLQLEEFANLKLL